MASSRWTEAETTALIDTIYDGVLMNTVLQAVQATGTIASKHRTMNSIRTKARDKKLNLNYRGSEIDGKFHSNVSRRKHTKKKENQAQEESAIATIVGEPRVTTNNSTPTTTSETINTESDDIISDIALNKEYKGLKAYAN